LAKQDAMIHDMVTTFERVGLVLMRAACTTGLYRDFNPFPGPAAPPNSASLERERSAASLFRSWCQVSTEALRFPRFYEMEGSNHGFGAKESTPIDSIGLRRCPARALAVLRGRVRWLLLRTRTETPTHIRTRVRSGGSCYRTGASAGVAQQHAEIPN
jgi:hypothetical protein